MNRFEKYLGLLMLLFAIGFNLWVYRLEPTVLVDPNDNTFQFALVDRTNQVWDFAVKKCSSPKQGSHPAWGWKDAILPMCQVSFLVDHWVPNWAQGYNLPYYYSHLPQILIVTSWRLLHWLLGSIGSISLFQYYHLVTYLLLSLFPLSIFLSLRVISLPYLAAGFGTLIASHISTDGLYGLDPASFLWRGWGLSSQLFAMIWLPLALAYAHRYVATNGGSSIGNDARIGTRQTSDDKRNGLRHRNRLKFLVPAILALAATTAGHLGIGIIAFLSTGILAVSNPLLHVLLSYEATKLRSLSEAWLILWNNLKKLMWIYGGVLLLLGYWIIPALLHHNYHNISVWDPSWKFNSYGAKTVLTNLLNGDLFDYGRLPILTLLMIVGFFTSLWHRRTNESRIKISNNHEHDPTQPPLNVRGGIEGLPYFGFALLFLLWLILYFGRTTWGPLIDLVPGMKEFHLSRFIVGVHSAGLFLIPIGVHAVIAWFQAIIQQYGNITIPRKWLYCCIVILLGIPVVLLVYPQTLRYASHNDFLIRQANQNFVAVKSDVDALLLKLRSYEATTPGRVFAGRGGNWGRDFRVAETPYYMFLSTYGIPVILWLPETWSPNSDTEQYFSENNPTHYSLYNVRYVVTPPNLPQDQVQPFWRLKEETKTWKLYEVSFSTTPEVNGAPTSGVKAFGYFTAGVRPAIVATDKESFSNVVRLWMHSDYPQEGLFPELTFAKDFPRTTGLPNFAMLDEVTYKVPDGSIHNLFQDRPTYLPPGVTSVQQLNNLTTKQYGNVTILFEESDTEMVFRAKVKVGKDCGECVVVLKQTYHPNWRATIDGKSAPTINVFPFFVAVPIDNEGVHEVTLSYHPSTTKLILLFLTLGGLVLLPWLLRTGHRFLPH